MFKVCYLTILFFGGILITLILALDTATNNSLLNKNLFETELFNFEKVQLNQQCVTNGTCSESNNEECDTEKEECVCKYNYEPKGGRCKPSKNYCTVLFLILFLKICNF